MTQLLLNGQCQTASYALYALSKEIINVVYYTIPNGVTYIGGAIFSGCNNLSKIEVEEGNSYYDSRNNCNAIVDISTNTLNSACRYTSIPNSVTSIGDGAFSGFEYLNNVTIPNNVTKIGLSAFADCTNLNKITMPNSLTNIGYFAFWNCSSLSEISIPSSVTEVGKEVFVGTAWYNKQPDGLLYMDGWNLGYKGDSPSGTVNIKEGTIGVAGGAFDLCDKIADISLPSSMKYICSNAFSRVGVTSLTIPNHVVTIGSSAFEDCYKLSRITIPSSVTSIGFQAFFRCGLTTVNIPEGVTHIGAQAFYCCSELANINIPASVTTIGSAAFSGTEWLNSQPYGLVYLDNWLLGYNGEKPRGSVVIADGTKGIADYSLYYCNGMTSVTIPESITSIGDYAFAYCTSLIGVTSLISEPFTIDENVFQYNDQSDMFTPATLYVPKGTKGKYGSISGWNKFTTILETGESLQPKGDVNGDNVVDVADIAAIISVMAGDATLGSVAHYADVNGDGTVDVADIATIISEMAASAR